MQNDEWHLRTYAVLIVDIVNLVDSESLPLVQLLLLECKRDILMRIHNDIRSMYAPRLAGAVVLPGGHFSSHSRLSAVTPSE